MALLTDEQLATRECEIRRNLADAERKYGQAALTTALDPASDEQATAAEEVKRLRDQLDAIDMAQREKFRAEKQARHDAQIAAWEATRAEIDTITEEAETFAAGLDDIRQQLLTYSDRYAADYARIAALLKRHRGPTGQGLHYALFAFNTQREKRMKEASGALDAVARLHEMFVTLGGDAGAAANELQPREEHA